MPPRITIAPGDSDLIRKKASFIQHSLPGLEAGRYQIDVVQSLLTSAAEGGHDITGGGLPSLTRRFGVAAPRYSLSQAAIHSVFPPANSAGEFSGSFAHVVLETETLPWLRSPYSPLNEPPEATRCYSTVVNGEKRRVEYDEDRASWLAVMLVSPSDFAGLEPSRRIVQGTVRDLIPSVLTASDAAGRTVQGALPPNAYSVFSYLLEPQYRSQATQPVDPGVGQSIADAVQYIDVPSALFDAIAPSLDDLKMMAHVRAVRMDSKPIAAGQTVDAEERYALVIGNRLPESKADPAAQPPPEATSNAAVPALGTNVALLVSLEAMEFALRGHTPGDYYDSHVANGVDGVVRLPVLYQWRFTSWQDTSFEFETLLKGLNGREASSANAAVAVPNPWLRLPAAPVAGGDDSQAIVADMLASGFVPFAHVTRVAPAVAALTPVQTVSWYRGPLMPDGAFSPDLDVLATLDGAAQPLIFTADQLLRFDPNVGMYDVSFAAAWQLGRLLALSSKDFSVALYRWKKQVAVQYRILRDRQALPAWYENREQLLRYLALRKPPPTPVAGGQP